MHERISFHREAVANDRFRVLRNPVICMIQEASMSRDNESVDISAILDAIKEAKSSLQDIIEDIQDSDTLEETVNDEVYYSGLDVPYDALDEEFREKREAKKLAGKVLRDSVFEPMMSELKQSIINYVDHTVWYHEDRLGDWMNKVAKYSILQGLAECARSECFDLVNRRDYYESFNERVEDVLSELRKTIMLESDGGIVLDSSFKNCDITVHAEESLEALDALYKGEGWIQEFMDTVRKENELSDTQIENILESDTEFDDDDAQIHIWKISQTMLEYEYESLQQDLEFTSIMGFEPLQDMVDDLIRVKPAKEYEEKLEALLRDRFALVNEKIQELRFDVSW